MDDKTVIFNVASGDNGRSTALANVAQMFAPDGGEGKLPTLTLQLTFCGTSMDFTASAGFIGSVLVSTPNTKLTIGYPGHSGRMIVNDDVVHEKGRSEFHNYEFYPVCPLPLPECCIP
jgi:hypothetical protein